MKTILVPTDFSAYSLTALQYGIYIAKKMKAKVILMHVYDLMDTMKGIFKNFMDHHYKNEKNELLKNLDEIRHEVLLKDKLEITTMLTYGSVTNNILFVAEKFKVDLIVMGTLGSTGLKTSILGSKAASVLRNSKAPVLIIPKNFKWVELKNILITVKDEQEKVENLAIVFELIDLFKADVRMLTFTDEREEEFEAMADTRAVHLMKDRLQRNYPYVPITSVQLSGENFTKTLEGYIFENKIDLLVMINYHHSWIHQLFGTSATQNMALHSVIPLLSINPDPKKSYF